MIGYVPLSWRQAKTVMHTFIPLVKLSRTFECHTLTSSSESLSLSDNPAEIAWHLYWCYFGIFLNAPPTNASPGLTVSLWTIYARMLTSCGSRSGLHISCGRARVQQRCEMMYFWTAFLLPGVQPSHPCYFVILFPLYITPGPVFLLFGIIYHSLSSLPPTRHLLAHATEWKTNSLPVWFGVWIKHSLIQNLHTTLSRAALFVYGCRCV